MENEKYLVILCSHVDSEKKRKKVMETLRHFKEEGVDVCFCSHSSNYMDEICSMSKFSIFDGNNEFITKNSYLQNADLLDENFANYGLSFDTQSHSFGTVIDHKTGSPHSRSALSLLKNGTFLSASNFYKWTVYLEYDIPVPIGGFKNFIEDKINLLKRENKKCFHYLNDTSNFKFLWGGFFVFQTMNIFGNERFMGIDWASDSRKWISSWKLGFFESIVENIIGESFNDSEIIKRKITEDCKSVWGVESYPELSKFKFEDTIFREENSLDRNIKIGVYPSLIKDDYKLFLYIFNSGSSTEIELKEISIKNDEMNLFALENFISSPFCWNLWEINYQGSKNIYLNYTISDTKYSKENFEYFSLSNIDKITERLSRIEFK